MVTAVVVKTRGGRDLTTDARQGKFGQAVSISDLEI